MSYRESRTRSIVSKDRPARGSGLSAMVIGGMSYRRTSWLLEAGHGIFALSRNLSFRVIDRSNRQDDDRVGHYFGKRADVYNNIKLWSVDAANPSTQVRGLKVFSEQTESHPHQANSDHRRAEGRRP